MITNFLRKQNKLPQYPIITKFTLDVWQYIKEIS